MQQLISREVIERWLEGCRGMRGAKITPDQMDGGSGGQKAMDGVHGGAIHAIMLDEAVSRMEAFPETRPLHALVHAHFYDDLSIKDTIGVLRSMYPGWYSYQKFHKMRIEAVEFIYFYVNGGSIDMSVFVDTLKSLDFGR